MDQTGLVSLRKQIVNQMQQMAFDGDGEPNARLQIMLEMMRSDSATTDMFPKAYEVAQQIEDSDEKMNAMLDLIFEIDRRVAAGQNEQPSEPDASVIAGQENVEQQLKQDHEAQG